MHNTTSYDSVHQSSVCDPWPRGVVQRTRHRRCPHKRGQTVHKVWHNGNTPRRVVSNYLSPETIMQSVYHYILIETILFWRITSNQFPRSVVHTDCLGVFLHEHASIVSNEARHSSIITLSIYWVSSVAQCMYKITHVTFSSIILIDI